MRLIEHHSFGKRKDQDLNEDGFFFSEEYAALIDGCSTYELIPNTTKSAGLIAKDLILKSLATLSPYSTYQEAFEAFNEALLNWYDEESQGRDFFQRNPHLRPGAYAAIVSNARRELWILGDCQALMNNTHYSAPKEVDALMEELRAFIIEALRHEGVSEKTIFENPALVDTFLRPIMAKQSLFQNSNEKTSFSYPTLDGFFTDYPSILVIELPSEPVEIVLASDGYPKLFPTLEESEQYLQEILHSDPLCYKDFRSTKGLIEGNASFDDRTYLRFIV
ncbi:MAG: hypothetical protein WC954_07610 [Sphaerochaeta sp.]